ncbi:TIGR03557 family F420-dependent LLM class oxidoreductase [Actinospica sp. MGRD01-02]|uniref:TIGR03557 family F420-dependent LLM class oxidoreductase n=1 Tax=Actinospica acidithermotolerans TaxID=2828514 RepID=A0A941EEQ2_9ACTN|nr:TIGR03557 family F420-dependent LLM class oxidoreductase [Actinospica acidithermotolerans]MBR7829117.1 TIGR03557 family F420-dependent LLM class oxidoreductase [Actinospica acidithermotolerans]
MARVGYFLSSEEFSPPELVEQAKMAEDAGFHALWISDHFHPWNEEQGESGFVWGTIGAISQAVDLPITTAVTCPTVRLHPAIIAQAAASAAVQTGGRFTLGVGSGEALNEHILGDGWPASTGKRIEMLEEAVEVIRKLWTGEVVTHHGSHYTVEGARIYTLPEQPPEIYVSGFGPRSARLAGRIGDGYVSVFPDAGLVGAFRESGGAGKPAQGGFKVCWSRDRAQAEKTAYRLWNTELLPGELAQVLPQPAHFEQAAALVTEQAVADHFVCGDDVDEHLGRLSGYFGAGYDEVFVNQIGPEQRGFFDFYAKEILPAVESPTD